MKTLQYAMLGLVALLVLSVQVEAKGTPVSEPNYPHIKALLGQKLIDSNAAAARYLAANPHLPHWSAYPGQCDLGVRRLNSQGVEVCVRRQHGNTKNKSAPVNAEVNT